MENTASTAFVYIDGTVVSGPLSQVKALVAAYVDAKFSAGSGARITGASDDIEPWLLDLTKQYPWDEWEARELARLDAELAKTNARLRAHLRVVR